MTRKMSSLSSRTSLCGWKWWMWSPLCSNTSTHTHVWIQVYTGTLCARDEANPNLVLDPTPGSSRLEYFWVDVFLLRFRILGWTKWSCFWLWRCGPAGGLSGPPLAPGLMLSSILWRGVVNAAPPSERMRLWAPQFHWSRWREMILLTLAFFNQTPAEPKMFWWGSDGAAGATGGRGTGGK